MIGYSRQHIDQKDVDSVVEALKSDLITQGEQIGKFEQSLCEYTEARYAVACSHGTSALHLACLALGISHGDIVWVPAISFVASANCAIYCGAKVEFVDIEPDFIGMCPIQLEQKLKRAAKLNLLPKAIVVVDYAGQAGHLAQIYQLAKAYQVNVIEDACHALGADYLSDKVGSCGFADITVFSFHPVKSITTGEGGAVLTNNESLANRLRRFANHGIERSDRLLPWEYEQVALGFNYRITSFQAALGISQLEKLDEFINERRKLAKVYDKAFASSPIEVLKQNPGGKSAYHLYPILLPKSLQGQAKVKLFNNMKKNGFSCQVHYIPIPNQPYFKQRGSQPNDFPNAQEFYQKALSIPLYVGLSHQQQQKFVDCLLSYAEASIV